MPATTFAAGATTVTFVRSPQRPERSQQVFQASAQSGAGVSIAGSVDAAELPWELSWRGMSGVDLAALTTFFTTTVRGMADTFSWTDTDGVARMVRFGAPEVESTEISPGRYNVRVVLWEA